MKNIIIITLAINLFTACGSNKNKENVPEEIQNTTLVELTNDQLKNAGIVIGKAEQKNISSILKVNGVIDVPPQNMVSISVPLGGYLKSTKLLPGMHLNNLYSPKMSTIAKKNSIKAKPQVIRFFNKPNRTIKDKRS